MWYYILYLIYFSVIFLCKQKLLFKYKILYMFIDNNKIK